MRKELLPLAPAEAASISWLDIGAHGVVRLTSEDAAHPIERALQDGADGGWRAAAEGAQVIWISFDVPQAIQEIHLSFEIAATRTQEFVLLCSTDGGRSYRDIVRQQFNFSAATPSETEHYFPQLSNVTDLKLNIVPDIAGGSARATLHALRLR